MPITASWDDTRQTTIIMRFPLEWTWREVYEITEQIYVMMAGSPGVVDVILEWSEGCVIPPGAIRHTRHLIATRSHQVGLCVFVNTNTMFHAMWSMFSNLYGTLVSQRRFSFAGSVAEARTLLRNEQMGRTRPI